MLAERESTPNKRSAAATDAQAAYRTLDDVATDTHCAGGAYPSEAANHAPQGFNLGRGQCRCIIVHALLRPCARASSQDVNLPRTPRNYRRAVLFATSRKLFLIAV